MEAAEPEDAILAAERDAPLDRVAGHVPALHRPDQAERLRGVRIGTRLYRWTSGSPRNASMSAASSATTSRRISRSVVSVGKWARSKRIRATIPLTRLSRYRGAAPPRGPRARAAAAGPGGIERGRSTPRWSYARAVARRPADVRIRNPCWSRYGSTTSVRVSVSSWSVAASASMPTGPPPYREMIAAEHLAVELVQALVVDAFELERRLGHLDADRRPAP